MLKKTVKKIKKTEESKKQKEEIVKCKMDISDIVLKEEEKKKHTE